jgi:hypothetical protein
MSQLDGLPTTFSSIRRVRELLPGCEIVLSTWKGQDTRMLDVDLIIENNDPGGQMPRVAEGVVNNVNRQIVSTREGLKQASNELCLKLRSDIVLVGAGFIDAFKNAVSPIGPDAVFTRKIISNNLSSRNPRSMPDCPLPYHPADHAHFGLRDDLLTLWDIPLQSQEDADYFLSRPRPNHFRDNETSRLNPEQYICTSAFAKKQSIYLPEYSTQDADVINRSEAFMTANFVFLPDSDFAIHLGKYHNPHHAQFEWMRYPPNSKGNPPGRLRSRILGKIRRTFYRDAQ